MAYNGKVGAGSKLPGMFEEGDNLSTGKLSRSSLQMLDEYKKALADAGIYAVDQEKAYRQLLIKDEAKQREKLIKEVNRRLAYEQASDLKKVFMDISENFAKSLSANIGKALSNKEIDNEEEERKRFLTKK